MLSLVIIPGMIIPLAFLMVIISGCSRICTKNWTKVDSMRSINRIFLMATMVTYFLLPEVLMHLMSTTSCFDSITQKEPEDENADPIDTSTRRMSILTDEFCDGEFSKELFYTYVLPGLCTYGLLLPLLVLFLAARKSQLIYLSGSGVEYRNSDDENERSIIDEEAIKYKFGFLFSGYTVSKLKVLPKH
jgi:hypothetical protein